MLLILFTMSLSWVCALYGRWFGVMQEEPHEAHYPFVNPPQSKMRSTKRGFYVTAIKHVMPTYLGGGGVHLITWRKVSCDHRGNLCSYFIFDHGAIYIFSFLKRSSIKVSSIIFTHNKWKYQNPEIKMTICSREGKKKKKKFLVLQTAWFVEPVIDF